MAGQLKEVCNRIKSIQNSQQITKAMKMVSAAKLRRAQDAIIQMRPYAQKLQELLSNIVSSSEGDLGSSLAVERPVEKVLLIVITSDRGLAGAYSSSALRAAEQLTVRLRDEGMDPVPYVVGRKGVAFYRFRNREMVDNWTGFSEQPKYENAKEVADTLIDAFLAGSDEGGIDEIHLVFTEFITSVTQRPKAVRLLPLVVEETTDDEGPMPLYEFEPSAEGVLDALLPRYLESRVWNALLQSAAAESAARRRAMKSASDNADELIKGLVRAANAARQAEITQEIMEIVGGAEALSGGSE